MRKNRLTKFIFLLALILGTAATNVSDAPFTAILSEPQSCCRSLNNIITETPLSTQQLVEAGLIGDLTEIELQDIDGTTDIPFMPPPIGGTAFESAHQDNGGVFTVETTDLEDAGTLDVAILPAVPAVSDAFYACAHHQFLQMRFDISQAGVAATDWVIAWEYFNGATWVALPGLEDNTDQFRNAGSDLGVSWDLVPLMSEVRVNDTVGYCVRARATNAGVAPYTQPLADFATYDRGILHVFEPRTPVIFAAQSRSLSLGFASQGHDDYGHFNHQVTNLSEVSIPAAGAINDNFDSGGTWEIWSWAETAGEGSAGTLMTKGQPTLSLTGCTAVACNLRFHYDYSGSDGSWDTTGLSYVLGQWNHTYVSFDNADIANVPVIGINNSIQTLVSTQPTGTRVSDTGDALTLGNGSTAFNGLLDDARAWDDIRTAAEILANFAPDALSGGEPDLAARWEFSDMRGLTVTESVANNDGAITGWFQWDTEDTKLEYLPGYKGFHVPDHADLELGSDYAIEFVFSSDAAEFQGALGVAQTLIEKNNVFRVMAGGTSHNITAIGASDLVADDLMLQEPDADVVAALTASGCASNFQCVDDSGADDGDTTHLATTSDTFVRDYYTLGDVAAWGFNCLQEDFALWDSLVLTVAARETAGVGEMRFGIRINNDEVISPTHALGGGYADDVLAITSVGNPLGGSSYTWGDLEDAEVFVELRNTAGGAEESRVSDIDLEFDCQIVDLFVADPVESWPDDGARTWVRIDSDGAVGNEMRIIVNGRVANTGGPIAAIANNTEDWRFFSHMAGTGGEKNFDTAVPGAGGAFMEYMRFEVPSGTVKAEWRPNTSAFSFNDATELCNFTDGCQGPYEGLAPDYAAIRPDRTSTLSALEETNPNVAAILDSTPDLIADIAPDASFAGDTGSASGNFIDPSIQRLAAIANVPGSAIWVLLMLFMTVLSLVVTWKYVPIPFVPIMVSAFVMSMFVVVGVIAWWLVLVYAVVGIAAVVIVGRGVSVGV